MYDGTAAFLRELQLDKDALTKAIIGTIGDIDSYQLPDAKGHTAFVRHLLKISDADRQERREQILSTSLKDFRQVLLLYLFSSSYLFKCQLDIHHIKMMFVQYFAVSD